MTNKTERNDIGIPQAKILFTGTGERMINNVIALLPKEYKTVQCQATETDFLHALNQHKPHVVLVCLQNETRDMLRVYDILWENEAFLDQPIIAVGYIEDCTQFTRRLPIKNMKTFSRPLEREGFLETLDTYIEIAKQKAPAADNESKPESEQQEAMEKMDDFEAQINRELNASDREEHEKELVRKTEHLSMLYGRKSILVVDDDVRMLNVIKLYLQDLYDVTIVPNGKLALKYISKKPVDLVLLDYMMPEMDGPDVLQQIRETSPLPRVPVVFLTGVADKDLVLRGLEFLPNGYLLKPISREDLLEKVTEIVLEL